MASATIILAAKPNGARKTVHNERWKVVEHNAPQSVASLILERFRQKKDQESREDKPSVPVAIRQVISDNPQEASYQKMKEITRLARANRDHYLSRQSEDNYTLPWYRYRKSEVQYSEYVSLTKKMAKEMQDHMWKREDGNRGCRPTRVSKYRHDIDTDNWIPSDESLSIDMNGEPYNGNHRIEAFLTSSKEECVFYFTWNVLPEARWVTDSGGVRNTAERLSMVVDPKLGKDTAPFVRSLMTGLQFKGLSPSPTELAEFAYKYDWITTWVSKHLGRVTRAEVRAAIAKAYIAVRNEPENLARLESFCERFVSITDFQEGDPARALYVAMVELRKKQPRKGTAYRKTLGALHALFAGKKVHRLHENNKDIFNWLPDWELPRRQDMNI